MTTLARVSLVALREAVHTLDVRARIEDIPQGAVVIEKGPDGEFYLHLDVPEGPPSGFPALTLCIGREPVP